RSEEGMDASVLTDGLVRAAAGAYQAVQHPVEGTILTVASGAAQAAGSVRPEGGLVGVLEAARHGADEALARTPDLLPVLTAAGVVDSGGAGYVLLLDALLHVADGRPLPDCPNGATARPGPAHMSAAGELGADSSRLRYEVMYLLEAPDESIPP